MKTSSNYNMHRKTAVVATKTGTPTRDHKSGRSASATPTTTTNNNNSSSNLGAMARDRLPRHTSTMLHAKASESEPSSSSTTTTRYHKFVGVFRRRIHRLFSPQQQQQDSSTTKSKSKSKAPRISPAEPYLYLCPDGLHRYYKPLPSIVRVWTVCMAAWISFGGSMMMILIPSQQRLKLSVFHTLRQLTVRLIRLVAYALVAQIVLQDTLFANSKRPSRVTMNTLLQKYFLPSSLSKYEPITVEEPPPPLLRSSSIANPNATTTTTTSIENQDKEPSTTTLGVHYLQYDNTDTTDETADQEPKNSTATATAATPSKKRSFAAMYFQHGFGASSLSWLPVLPKLAKQMNARVALGHDTVGFGFTDRPQNARWYRPKQAATIAFAILAKQLSCASSSAATAAATTALLGSNDETPSTTPPKAAAPVCLVGHSMGSRATLRLATQLPAETPKLIVLSSPALGLIAPKLSKAKTESSSAIAAVLQRVSSFFQTVISRNMIQPSARYFLRRIIGTNGSWRKGLEAAWGDPKSVKEDSDVLRYSWPSIGRGWEEGILTFAKAQVLEADDALDDDFLLMRTVLQLPRTKVLILLGSRDRVIPTRSVERFLERVVVATPKDSGNSNENENENDSADALPIVVELEGLGHCAFEEDPEVFCKVLEELVKENWDTRKE